ncbi:hypothetical protein KLP40_06840 [Hymenobacter sp. NST-14]|uniref:hypothetical protein n=1 Tax=Hymenobacter piscis TaxID=2839984 RepID=UPI001C026A5D|nr:hypothetical protein [Hymenobacter piscis]MBT9392875.1 hypothetical protein [Hymenobacter piscis]
MNMSVKEAYAAFLVLLFLCSNCTQDRQRAPKPEGEAFTPYTLELITLLIPSSWQKKDYEPNSESVEEPYVFMAPKHQQDSLLGDAVMVVIKKKEKKPDFRRLKENFVKSIEVDGQNRVRMLSYQDSVLADMSFVLIDYDNTIPALNLNQVCTYACYHKKGAFITIVGVARRGSTQENRKKRVLFRKIIHSIKWISE